MAEVAVVTDSTSYLPPDLVAAGDVHVVSLYVTDAGGQPSLLVVIVTDVTAQVEAEARFEATFAANPAPSLICRLTDQRFVKVNEGFLELTGFKRDEVLGQN